MPSSIHKRPGRKLWRVMWRDGGREAKQRTSEWFSDKYLAEQFQAAIEERHAVAKSTDNRLVLPWSEVRAKWIATLEGPYKEQARRVLKRHTDTWQTTADATPTTMGNLPLGAARIARSCLRWSWLHHRQQIDQQALRVEPRRIRPRRKPGDLIDPQRVAELVAEAGKWSPGNGALAHLLATYGHRAQSLVHLTPEAVKDGILTIKVKGGDTVSHPLLPQTLAILGGLGRKPGTPLFLNHLGERWRSGQAFASWFGHVTGTGYYSLKRAAISRMFAAGIDAKTIASITGHRTVSLLLNTYAQTNEKRQALALAAIAAVLPTVPAEGVPLPVLPGVTSG